MRRATFKYFERRFSMGLIFIFCCTVLFGLTKKEETVQKGLDFVRNGCFKDAGESFREIIGLDPSSPDAYFFVSFTNFIHLIYNPSNQENRVELGNNLKRSIELGEQKINLKNGSYEAKLFLGTSYLLESYYLALKKEVISAAFSARKGKKVLESLLKENPEFYDAYFGLGIYNYYADRVPSIVKGIRFLLFLPGGDRKLGLSQLKLASLKSKYFNAESSMILAEIYANKFEKDYYTSYVELSAQANSDRKYLLILHALAKLQMKILNFEDAARLLEIALELAEDKGSDQDVLTYLKFHLAKCYFLMNRADSALPYFEAVLSQAQTCNDSLIEETLTLTSQALILTGQPQRIDEIKKVCADISKVVLKAMRERKYSETDIEAYRKNMEALELSRKGDLDASIKMLKTTLDQNSSSALTRLILGEILIKSHEPEAAFDAFNQIIASPASVSRQVKDIAELRSGNCLDLMKKRKLAEETYRRIILKGKSPAQEAAYFYLKTPFSTERSAFIVQPEHL